MILRKTFRYIIGLFPAIFFSIVPSVYSYEIDTHDELSKQATLQSNLYKYLPGVGLKTINDQLTDISTTKTIIEWIRQGAKDEDNTVSANFFRYRNHFYDPQHGGVGYSYGYLSGEPSPDWALEDTRTFFTQSYSLKEARQYFYDALTLPNKDNREMWMARTFYTLGHVIHHTQDMAQPQHTRNDSHGGFGLGSPSLYEIWTKDHPSNPAFTDALAQNYGPVTFDQARKFWTDRGRGIAEFSSYNFVSAGTNFDQSPGQAGYFTFPQRLLGPPESVDIQQLLKEKDPNYTCDTAPPPGGGSTPLLGAAALAPRPAIATIVPPPGGGNPDPLCRLQGRVEFVATTVEDKYTGISTTNARASTFSIFDQDLKKYNVIDSAGHPMSAYTLNEFTFQAAYPYLITKAVGYSAGLIDYFFRGKLEIQSINDDGNQLTIEVKNISGADNTFKSGDFSFYYDDIDGARVPLTLTQNAKLTGSLAHNAMLTLTANKPKLSRVDPAKDKPLLLVFKGVIGQEEGVAATVIEMPLSGFVVIPSYPPADGIVGPRHLFREDGQWMLSKRAGVAAGNIDWKGWYVNGRPSRVLTWWGPNVRYFPNNSINGSIVDNSGPQIYQNGTVFARAPSVVLGAAMT